MTHHQGRPTTTHEKFNSKERVKRTAEGGGQGLDGKERERKREKGRGKQPHPLSRSVGNEIGEDGGGGRSLAPSWKRPCSPSKWIGKEREIEGGGVTRLLTELTVQC